LQVVAGLLQLDLELRVSALKQRLRMGEISHDDYGQEHDKILDIWEQRWNASLKGRWSYEWFPSAKGRYVLPLELEHFVTQFLTVHGDFNGKLFGFKLTASTAYGCGAIEETAEHVLFVCPRVIDPRHG